ncbi:hypothetical protein BGZ96_000858 [Linnemannia gamsii]|uniref:VPS9 domain-containing protein n=1 Tax=Linnemannia gamsii TaxID=64522 RepID=A0ABQ7JNG2_9FUNG|nr:hypothetical protein BGZ96_000858 [Linnemannia gamsii]
MSRNEVQEPRNRSNSLSAAWSFLFRGQGSKQQQHHSQHSSQSSSPKHQTIREEEDDDEDKAWGKGVTRKVLPQQRRSTSSVHSSPNASSRTSPTLNPKRMSDVPRHPSALERIAIHNGNINNVLASTHDHNMSLPPLNKVNDRRDKIYYDRASLVSEEDRQHNNSASHVHHPPCSQPTFVNQEGKPALSSTRSGDHSGFLAKGAKDVCGSESADSIANSTADAHRSSSPASTSSVPSSSCPSPPSDIDTIPGPAARITSQSSKTGGLTSNSASSSAQSAPPIGLGLNGMSGQKSSEYLQWTTPPLSGPSYFDITPSHNTSPPSSKKSAGYVTKTPGRRTKRTPAHSISSTITNGGTSSRRVSCTLPDSSSQNSASFLDEREVEIDENSFYMHLQKMQERHAAQQEPGWLRTQHALLQAKHRTPSSGQQHLDIKGRKSGFVPGSQPFLSRIHSNSSSPSSSDYGSSPSFHPGLQQQQRQPYSGGSSSQRQQPIHALNCFQPGNVICVPRERTLGGLIFHKTFVETHILTPSPYYRGQYLTLDNRVVEIDKEYVKEISGFAQPRSVKILSEETVYNGSSQKPTRVLMIDRPLEGDGVALNRSLDGPVMPIVRNFSSDMAFLVSFPELSRALRDFNNLCQEFEKTYVYIRGFATYTLDKLRLIYEKAYRDCLGDSVKLQKMLMYGVQAEQDTFAELIENIVLGKLYQKLFIHSLVPCYAQRDVDVDETIETYHRYLFSLGGHRGIESGSCLASSEGPLLTETLKKFGLSEKMWTMRLDHALDGAAGLLRAWDQQSMEETIGLMTSPKMSTPSVAQETEQERKRRELRESLRVFVQDSRPKSEIRTSNHGFPSEQTEDADDDEEQDPEYVWNTPLEKVICIKQVLDTITIVAEDHLMNGQGAGFVQRKRSEVSVTTDDFIPLLAIVIIQARMMRLGSNMFYLERFRINSPKSDHNFALVTFGASVEFLKSDPLGLLGVEPNQVPSAGVSVGQSESVPGSNVPSEDEFKTPSEETPIMPWGTPSQTGWGFSPPKSGPDVPTFELLTPGEDVVPPLGTPAKELSPSRPPLANSTNDFAQQYQQRHTRSTSMNIDDRFRRVGHVDDAGSGSSYNSSWSRSPMIGPRFTSGTNSPLGVTSPTQGPGSTPLDAASGSMDRRQSHQPPSASQRHSISSGQVHMFNHAQYHHHHHRISVEQGRETMHRPTILPLQSPNMTPQLVVKPQIMLPPPKTPPMSGQNTTGRSRPMSMISVGALSSSPYSGSYGSPGTLHTRERAYTSNHSSPATSPRLGPGMGSRHGSRSNSLMSGSFPMLRTNSMTTVLKAQELQGSDQLPPVSPGTLWLPKNTGQGTNLPAFSASPSQFTESPGLLPASTASVTIPKTPEQPSKASRTGSGSNQLGRIRTSPASTTSSISTPTTPSTFSPSSSNALLDSLNTSVQLMTPPSVGPSLTRSKIGHSAESSVASSSSSITSSETGSVRSKSSIGRQNSLRLTIPKLALSPSAPSTVFCKTTVASAATHETSIVDESEPSRQTVKATGLQGAKSAPEVPTLASLARSGGSHARARSPAISMSNSPFVFADLQKSSPLQSPMTQDEDKDGLSQVLADSGPPAAAERPTRIPQAEQQPLQHDHENAEQDLGNVSWTRTTVKVHPASTSSTSIVTTSATPTSPAFPQQHFQYVGRQSAPEIIPLSNPMRGSIVIGSGNSSSSEGKLVSSSYTPSYHDQHLRSSSANSSPGGIHLVRRSLDGPRPSSSLGYYSSSYGSNHVSEYSSGPGFHSQQPRQSSPLLNPIPRQQPSYANSSYNGGSSSQYHQQIKQQHGQHHQRQHSTSASTSHIPQMSSSFTYNSGSGYFPRGLGILTPSSSSDLGHGHGSSETGSLKHSDKRNGGSGSSMNSDSVASSARLDSPWFTPSPAPSAMSSALNQAAGEASWAEEGSRLQGDNQGVHPLTHEAPGTKESGGSHSKMDSGKYVGHQHQRSSSSTTYSAGVTAICPVIISATAATEHVSHGTALEFDRDFCLDTTTLSSDSRRGSTTSLRAAKSTNTFQPEQVILPWSSSSSSSSNQNLSTSTGKGGVGSGGNRLGVSTGSFIDLPAAINSSLSSSTSTRPVAPFSLRTGGGGGGSGTVTPTLSGSFLMESSSSTLMGDFLSELAKVEDGDVLVGNGRSGFVSRQ